MPPLRPREGERPRHTLRRVLVDRADLAREIGIAHQHLGMFEQGLRPWPAARKRLASYYQVSEDEF